MRRTYCGGPVSCAHTPTCPLFMVARNVPENSLRFPHGAAVTPGADCAGWKYDNGVVLLFATTSYSKLPGVAICFRIPLAPPVRSLCLIPVCTASVLLTTVKP